MVPCQLRNQKPVNRLSTPRRRAMSLPGEYADDPDVGVVAFLNLSYGRTFADDPAEMGKIVPIANAYKRICKVIDVEGLKEC